MDTRSIIIISLIVAVAAVIAILLLIVFKLRQTPVNANLSKRQNLTPDENLSLNALIDIAANKNSSKDELFTALKIFADKFQIPPKQNAKTPNEAKAYLSFVLLIASNPNADAKLIAFMSNELKKKNPTYANEIDLYEEQGRSRRRR
ncbi:fatty-acid--CoA ligase [Campylobacter sp.]|uniref:fatty-acid--CoA ligase n=1 Tax=Campylobacter sp. TaxID=205 RepID=UPI0026F78A8E|nr:fatty-acid--CoA ligase [Campylobacter sp.]